MLRTVHLSTFASILVVTAITQAATLTNSVQVVLSPDSSSPTGTTTRGNSGPGAVSASGSAMGTNATTEQGAGFANDGYISLGGQAAVQGNSTVTAIYNDSITISSLSVPAGTAGTLTFSISVSGDVTADSGSAFALFDLSANLGGVATNQISVSGEAINGIANGGIRYTGSPLGTFTATANFTYGVPFSLMVELKGMTGAGLGNPGDSGVASFDLNSNWQGISNLTASLNGTSTPVSDFSVASNSLTDYSAIVTPEPATAALLTPLAVLLLKRRNSH